MSTRKLFNKILDRSPKVVFFFFFLLDDFSRHLLTGEKDGKKCHVSRAIDFPFFNKKKKKLFFDENMCIEWADCVMTKKKTDVGGLKALN